MTPSLHASGPLPTTARNLVLGIVQNYDFAQVRPFLVSLRRTGYSGEIVFFYHRLDPVTMDAIRSMGVTLLPFRSVRGLFSHGMGKRSVDWLSRIYYQYKWPFYEAIWPWLLSPAKLRYHLYHRYLAEHGQRFDRVLLADTRDVFFQSDPFAEVPPQDLLLFEESHPIGHGALNSLWMTLHLGRPILDRLASRTTLCSGTIMGTPRALLFYLERIVTLMKSAECLSSPTGDQAFHNAVAYEGLGEAPFLVGTSPNGGGLVYTLSRYLDTAQIPVSSAGEVVDAQGRAVSILHQYDRHPAISRMLLEKIPTMEISSTA